MDEFHAARWGGVHISGLMREFHLTLVKTLAERNALRMSILVDRGVPISILYNIRVGNIEYNIQSAFSPSHAKGLSPGYLHLGYCLEDAHADGIDPENSVLLGQDPHDMGLTCGIPIPVMRKADDRCPFDHSQCPSLRNIRMIHRPRLRTTSCATQVDLGLLCERRH